MPEKVIKQLSYDTSDYESITYHISTLLFVSDMSYLIFRLISIYLCALFCTK